MKARALKKELNDTGYSVSNHDGYIAVGSPLCHDLFRVDKDTMKIKYALDTFNEGRECLIARDNEELLFIWDKLHELVDSGRINYFIEGKDEIDNPLPVYSIRNGKVIESFTDGYGWPNTTEDGETMYDNTHFDDREKAIKHGIEDEEIGIKIWIEELATRKDHLREAERKLERSQVNYYMLKNLL